MRTSPKQHLLLDSERDSTSTSCQLLMGIEIGSGKPSSAGLFELTCHHLFEFGFLRAAR
jgi:hypothetical protein